MSKATLERNWRSATSGSQKKALTPTAASPPATGQASRRRKLRPSRPRPSPLAPQSVNYELVNCES
jgi:hypothetical protein